MPLAETNRPRRDAGNSSNDITKPRKKRTKKVPRVSGVGPPLDPQTELRMIQQVVERDLFPSCKFINGSVDLDNIAKKSICRHMAKKLNVPRDQYLQAWWTRVKNVVKSKLNQCRTDATSALRKKYLGMVSQLYVLLVLG
jgi:hypothetical protein